MKFSYLAIKNFKGNIRKYISIFLCCSLCVVVLQVFLSILDNKNLENVLINKNIKMLLNFSLIVMAIFMVFFIGYAIQAFLKLRSKEFGLYLIIGMLRKELTRMVFIETSIIILLAICVGFILGTVLNYILFIILKSALELTNIVFTIHYISYLKTICFVLLIFFIQVILVWLYSKKLQLTEMIKFWKRPESIKMPGIASSLFLSFIAILLLFFSFFNLYMFISGTRGGGSNSSTPIIFVVCCFLSIFILISRVSTLIIYFCKKSKKVYYNNLLTITEISNKVNQNKKVILSATILFIVVIFFISSAYSILVDMPRVTDIEQPFHFAYADFNNSFKELDEIINKGNVKLKEHKVLDFLYGKRIIDFGKFKDLQELAVISDDNYNKISGKNLSLNVGESFVITSDLGGSKNEQFPYDSLILEFGDKSFNFKFLGEERTVLVNQKVQRSKFIMIIDGEDFNKIKSEVDKGYLGTFHLLNFQEWKNSALIARQLREKIESTGVNTNSKIAPGTFNVISKIEYYNSIKKEGSMRLFVVGFLGMLFLICMSCVIYFKMITDTEELRNKYKKLLRVGITKNEFKRVLSNQLKVIFFFPILLGAIIGYLLMHIATLNSRMEKTFALNTVTVIGVFFLFQLIYYLITRKKYYKDTMI